MTKEGIEFTKNQWIPALRSGKYIQGRSRLRDANEQFCCLGVACDLLENTLNLEVFKGEFIYSYNHATEYLPGIVTKYIGLSEETQETLANLNDVDRASFNQIADYLEDKILQLEAQPVSVLD